MLCFFFFFFFFRPIFFLLGGMGRAGGNIISYPNWGFKSIFEPPNLPSKPVDPPGMNAFNRLKMDSAVLPASLASSTWVG